MADEDFTNPHSLRCPHCGSEDSFQVIAKCVATLTHDGVSDSHSFDWDGDDGAKCIACKGDGLIGDFAEAFDKAHPQDATIPIELLRRIYECVCWASEEASDIANAVTLDDEKASYTSRHQRFSAIERALLKIPGVIDDAA